MTTGNDTSKEVIATYLRMTREVLPRMARHDRRDWPIQNDHCFQRVVLDWVCGGVWYQHLERPAYKHLSLKQAQHAVDVCQAIADGRADLHQMNNQSLVWRGKRPRPRQPAD